MPGLYLHIPFCKKACHYCNFHFSTVLRDKSRMVEALLTELDQRSAYLSEKKLSSIYFGGGTPSLLDTSEMVRIFEKIQELYAWTPDAEITLEANPDDLTREKISDLKQYTPVNRLSIGVQSFFEADLRWMNRAHSAGQAHDCLKWAHAAGFHNITLDLIYGLPNSDDTQWEQNLRTAMGYGVQHLSCYALTVESGTALAHTIKKGTAVSPDEEATARQFYFLTDHCAEFGLEQYEISNFAKPGFYAKHNTAYWTGGHYLGIGPAAHSYDGLSRQWNIANNALYMKGIEQSEPNFEREILTPANRYNEYVMTALRTQWGCNPEVIRQMGDRFFNTFNEKIKALVEQEMVTQKDGAYVLTRAGKIWADGAAASLFAD